VNFPQATNDNQRRDFIRRTRRIWQPRLGCDLTGEDARQIVENVSGFFSVLAEWSRAERANAANDNESADAGASIAAALTALTAAGREGAPDHD